MGEDAERQLEELNNEDFITMCEDTFSNIKMEEDIEELRSEVESLFVPQLQSRLPLARGHPKIFYELAKNLCKSYTFLQDQEKALAAWGELEAFLQSQLLRADPTSFSDEAQELSVELSGCYVNMASLMQWKEDHIATITYYQKAADVILPWIFEHNDMSPVPSLLGIAIQRIPACVALQDWKTLKDDMQTVASSQDIIDQLEEISKEQFDLSLNSLTFLIKQKRNAFGQTLKQCVDQNMLSVILQSNPEIELEGSDLQWVKQQYQEA